MNGTFKVMFLAPNHELTNAGVYIVLRFLTEDGATHCAFSRTQWADFLVEAKRSTELLDNGARTQGGQA